MVSFESLVVPLSTALGLSLGVERVLEFCKNLFERSIRSRSARKIPKLSDIDKKIEDLESLYKNAENAEDEEWEERVSINTILVEEATDPDDGTVLKVFTIQLLGVATGIFLARFFNVSLFNAFLESIKVSPIALWADYTLTGLLIGGGSGPIHVLIRFISERRVPAGSRPLADEEEEPASGLSAEPEKTVVAGLITTPPTSETEDWVHIPYGGGVDRDRLEDVHKRDKDPDLVIYHHTAMSHRSTFEDVVRVIKDREWLTGYNCVILPDGTVNPFCRWDRFGNHARGYNKRSLGIAFNGNYETDPKVPFSNPDGKYGPPRPTTPQIKAGARVVTLWAFLYEDIEIDFNNKIIPHNQISGKACPGTMFPYDEFKKWIEFYWNQWSKSETAQKNIEEFKLKPYLYT